MKAIIFLTVFLVSGCAIPVYKQQSPKVDGQVLSSGIPVSGVKVQMHSGLRDCSDTETRSAPIANAVTGEKGNFSLEGFSQFEFYIFPSEPGYMWTMCLEWKGKSFEGISDGGLGGLRHKEEKVVCDLSDKQSIRELEREYYFVWGEHCAAQPFNQ